MHLNLDPQPKDLVWFGAGLPVFAALLGYVVGHRSGSDLARQSIWLIGAALALVFWLLPRSRRAVFLGFNYLMYPIGWVVSRVLMGAVYLGVVTPTGILMRLFAKDLLARKLDEKAESYWVPHGEPRPSEDYFRQS